VQDSYNACFQEMFMAVMQGLVQVYGPELAITKRWDNSSDIEQEFIQNLALFYTSFLGEHLVVGRIVFRSAIDTDL